MVEPQGVVYVQKLPKVWYVWFPGDKKRRAVYPQPKEFWGRVKTRLEERGYIVLEIGIQELPEPGSS